MDFSSLTPWVGPNLPPTYAERQAQEPWSQRQVALALSVLFGLLALLAFFFVLLFLLGSVWGYPQLALGLP
jgi:hypothetical protein